MPHKEKRLKDAKAAAEEADFRVFQTHHGGSHDTEGYASLHPRLRATRSARAFDLSGRAAVIGCGKLVINSRGWAVADIISVKSVRDFHHIAHLRDENICEI